MPKMSNRSHPSSRLDLRAAYSALSACNTPVGLRLRLVGRGKKGERIIPFSLPTLYIYYTINLKKNQIIEFGVSQRRITRSLTLYIYYTLKLPKSQNLNLLNIIKADITSIID
jgi:hypothetical protein